MTASFIEKQFPVSKLSKESCKERKAGSSQTLTGLGKWWGRKPLVLVRAAILGCLMPASGDPRRDREIFLKIMGMDDDGLFARADRSRLDRLVRDEYGYDSQTYRGVNADRKDKFRKTVFSRLGYDAKIALCVRPEQFARPADDRAWNEINSHLGTHAGTLRDLARQLSEKRFGQNATIGDCFCGGGSVPFEAARMGLDVYASDLNPIACLLTWAAINICGADGEAIEEIGRFQREVYDAVDREIADLGIEHNENGDRAVSYLYCLETNCPECGMLVPMAPSWIIGKGTKTVATLAKNGGRYDIDVTMNADADEMKRAENGTVTPKGLLCPHCGGTTPIGVLRRDRKDENGDTLYGLRPWERSEFEPRPDDVYRERLYCVKYEKKPDGKGRAQRYCRAPNERDLQNEEKARRIVAENIVRWQERGLVPAMAIEPGDKTNELIRTRGWTHWSHLFNARQLLALSRFMERMSGYGDVRLKAAGLSAINKTCDRGSKLCVWNSGRDESENAFLNQALNSLYNYGVKSVLALRPQWQSGFSNTGVRADSLIVAADARSVVRDAHVWITDPPYADAVNYHELSEFFLAWDRRLLKEMFPDWHTDSKRALAVCGGGFARSMIDIYANLAARMPGDGMQIVMFAHPDPAVWAQLALILWKSGLKVTAAWNIATETESGGLKNGTHIRGTALLVLRKRAETREASLDEIAADITAEVAGQIESMRRLGDREDPNFSGPDYVLAAYAASLKVLTGYGRIAGVDLDRELDKAVSDPKSSKVAALVERAKKQAYDRIHG